MNFNASLTIILSVLFIGLCAMHIAEDFKPIRKYQVTQTSDIERVIRENSITHIAIAEEAPYLDHDTLYLNVDGNTLRINLYQESEEDIMLFTK